MASFNGWGTAWGGSWGPTETDPNAMAGSASISVTATGTLTAFALNVAAGKGSLADYEAEWALKRAQDAIEKAQGEPAKVRRRVRRQAAREVYFAPPLPDVAQVYVERLKAERYEAELAEMRALLDLSSQASAVKADVARAAVQMARKKQADAAQALEEFDVMYVAAILAEA